MTWNRLCVVMLSIIVVAEYGAGLHMAAGLLSANEHDQFGGLAIFGGMMLIWHLSLCLAVAVGTGAFLVYPPGLPRISVVIRGLLAAALNLPLSVGLPMLANTFFYHLYQGGSGGVRFDGLWLPTLLLTYLCGLVLPGYLLVRAAQKTAVVLPS